MNKKTIRDIDVAGKRVLVRVDFNVPLKNGEITDETRIQAALPTIQYLLGQNAKVVLCSHLGRPKGEFKPEFSLAPVARRLQGLLPNKVTFATDVVGKSADEAVANMKNGEVVLLENLRFHKEETKNDPEFAKKLASYGDIYVDDAFGAVHRAHASTAAVADYLPAVAGFLIEKELQFLGNAVENPVRPFVAILGGAKIAIFDILPVLGTGGIMIPWVILSALGGDLPHAFALLVLYVIITVIRNIIEPRIVGAQIGLHPVLTLMSMFVGNHLFGIVGLFGLPILLSLLRYLNDNGTISLFPASALGRADTETSQ